jgi:hypothetical protein
MEKLNHAKVAQEEESEVKNPEVRASLGKLNDIEEELETMGESKILSAEQKDRLDEINEGLDDISEGETESEEGNDDEEENDNGSSKVSKAFKQGMQEEE